MVRRFIQNYFPQPPSTLPELPQRQISDKIEVGSVVSFRHERVSLATNPRFLGYGLVKEIKKNSFGRMVYAVNPLSFEEKQNNFMTSHLTIRDEENPNPKKRSEVLCYEEILNILDESQVELAHEMLEKRLKDLQKFTKDLEMLKEASVKFEMKAKKVNER